jgi:hypothetical protein
MASKRMLVVDGYNVIKILRDFDVSFEEICSLGCSIADEPELATCSQSQERRSQALR